MKKYSALTKLSLAGIALVGGLTFFLLAWPKAELVESVNLVTLPLAAPTSTATKSAAAAMAPVTITRQLLAPVPFISQAPRGQWSDPDFQDGCEEASALMAMHWANGFSLNIKDATADISQLVNFQKQSPEGYRLDLSATDTAALMREYFSYSKIELQNNVRASDLVRELQQGKVIIAPVNGRLLNNPNFKPPGPLYHMLVVIGYDPKRQQFITNDPGTRKGAQYRYPVTTFMAALRDYPSGHNEEIVEKAKRVIVVGK